MTNQQIIAAQFMKKHNMHPDNIDFEMCVSESEKDMLSGLSGNRISFEMLPCFLSMKRLGNLSKKNILVLDAGGTNLRLATVNGENEHCLNVSIKEKQLMPGVKEPVEADELFSILAKQAKNYLSEIDGIGFCFSYAMEVQENRDGRIKFICKSIEIMNAEGRLVGQGLNDAIVAQGGRSKSITVVNDSTAVALAARTAGEDFGGYIGMIIGTGFNICYVENVHNIAGVDYQTFGSPDMLINMESDRFFKMQRGTFDLRYDLCSKDNDHPTMKMLTGAYLGGLCYLTFLGAAEENLLSKETTIALKKVESINTEDICAFINNPRGDSVVAMCCASSEDAEILKEIALLIVERASKLVAAILKAVLHRSYRYNDKPICICVEGSTIENVPTMKQKIREYLTTNLDEPTGTFKMITVENATIRGTAIAALQYN